MLVLSRGQSDRISFPSLGISIEVLKVRGKRTSIGVEAPKHIRVVRDEALAEPELKQLGELRQNAKPDSQQRHAFRNQFNRAFLNLQLAGKLVEQGEIEQGLSCLSDGLAELNHLEAATGGEDGSDDAGQAATDSEAAFGAADARVLLVDDDDNERVLMASYLRRCGIEVVEAGDGLQALYALAQMPRPDAVLLDMKMPNLDGPRTVNRIRSSQSFPELPVFAVTGESAESLDVSIDQHGVNGWFRKPIDIEQVVAAVKECRVDAG